jgi:hypothetical protein
MTVAGFNRPGVTCEHCEKPFPLFLAHPDVKNVTELPDPFQAVCPFCRQNATYPMIAIGILAAVSDQY